MAIISKLFKNKDKRRWATLEQVQWLLSWLPEYMEAQRQGKLGPFWVKLFAAWFKAYPNRGATDDDDSPSESESDDDSDVPPESADEEAVKISKRKKKDKEKRARARAKKAAANKKLTRKARIEGHRMSKKQKQLKTFMRWHCPTSRAPRKKRSTALSPWDFALQAGKPQRRLQESEAYIRLYYKTRIVSTVRERLDTTNASKPMIDLIRKVAKELYDKEDDTTRTAVKAYIEEQAVQAAAAALESGDLEAVDPTPEQYQDAINQLPTCLDVFIGEAVRRTGWSFVVFMGGPMPANNGDIQTASITAGKNTLGATFKETYPHFETAIVRPYGDFLRTVYSSDMRASRAIKPEDEAQSEPWPSFPAPVVVLNTAPTTAPTMVPEGGGDTTWPDPLDTHTVGLETPFDEDGDDGHIPPSSTMHLSPRLNRKATKAPRHPAEPAPPRTTEPAPSRLASSTPPRTTEPAPPPPAEPVPPHPAEPAPPRPKPTPPGYSSKKALAERAAAEECVAAEEHAAAEERAAAERAAAAVKGHPVTDDHAATEDHVPPPNAGNVEVENIPAVEYDTAVPMRKRRAIVPTTGGAELAKAKAVRETRAKKSAETKATNAAKRAAEDEGGGAKKKAHGSSSKKSAETKATNAAKRAAEDEGGGAKKKARVSSSNAGAKAKSSRKKMS